MLKSQKKLKHDMRRHLTDYEEQVLSALDEAGLEPYISVAAISGSCYIKFADGRLRSLRIGDHPGRRKYRYKWNLCLDLMFAFDDDDRGVTRFYYPSNEVEEMIQRMVNYLRKVQENDPPGQPIAIKDIVNEMGF